jgi:hypothetical protein
VHKAYAKGRLKTYTKTERSRRRVPLRAKVVAALNELPGRERLQRLCADRRGRQGRVGEDVWADRRRRRECLDRRRGVAPIVLVVLLTVLSFCFLLLLLLKYVVIFAVLYLGGPEWAGATAAGEALRYLASRGVSDEFAVGFAPTAKADLLRAAQAAGFTAEELSDVGLVSRPRGEARCTIASAAD